MAKYLAMIFPFLLLSRVFVCLQRIAARTIGVIIRLQFVIILLTSGFIKAGAQNLVSNASFEEHTDCPSKAGDLAKCLGWESYTGGSPDYFHGCASSGIAGVPGNVAGTQSPHDGQAYAGFATYSKIPSPLWSDYREYITTSIQPLVIGEMYQVSLSVSLSEGSQFGSNNIGVFFFDKGTHFIPTYDLVKVKPQISYSSSGVIMNTVDWIRLNSMFIPDSAYTNIVIGGFKPSDSILVAERYGGTEIAYYYVDSVVVRKVPKFNERKLCVGSSISVPYVVREGGDFSSDNIFLLQLSDPFGDFANAVTIGSANRESGVIDGTLPSILQTGGGYKVRIVSTSPEHTVWVYDDSIRIDFVSSVVAGIKDLPDYSGVQLTADASPGRSYEWTGPNAFVSKEQYPIIVSPTIADSGIYIVTATIDGCFTRDTINFDFIESLIGVPSAFSPNGDNINDILYINSSKNVQELHLKIFNRWGQMVFETTDIKKGWDGRVKGQALEPEVFGYVLSATLINGQPFITKGNVTLIR
ncbi:gliding motility-associated C-terminal domain-containing protein [Polluticoccus soli]|uniref:gliding motility-associated C-terminal domain-containing protein n=1 Tax=Polluticoccus soli TaxID=3034150 RepID=UPI0023E1BFCE|nr:gliding motility-associated C-terminal domain-containing protein [Flavipsychrobacter sp. JY13-12]